MFSRAGRTFTQICGLYSAGMKLSRVSNELRDLQLELCKFEMMSNIPGIEEEQ